MRTLRDQVDSLAYEMHSLPDDATRSISVTRKDVRYLKSKMPDRIFMAAFALGVALGGAAALTGAYRGVIEAFAEVSAEKKP